jgi:hypothetical protein
VFLIESEAWVEKVMDMDREKMQEFADEVDKVRWPGNAERGPNSDFCPRPLTVSGSVCLQGSTWSA